MLRIIAGEFRHRKIQTPDVGTTRPTTDKVREALMSALGEGIRNANVLDLFAGSGALGLEALSRGACKAVFCDFNGIALQAIRRNIAMLNVEDRTEVIGGHYESVLKKLRAEGEKFDLIFLDPPYAKKEIYRRACDLLFENDLMSERAVVVKEWNREIEEDERFSAHRAYHYGTVHVLIERR